MRALFPTICGTRPNTNGYRSSRPTPCGWASPTTRRASSATSFVQLPTVGDVVESGESFAEVESTKSVSDIYGPFAGTVAAVNADLDATPDLVNPTRTGPDGSPRSRWAPAPPHKRCPTPCSMRTDIAQSSKTDHRVTGDTVTTLDTHAGAL